jgi:hypothetical protein
MNQLTAAAESDPRRARAASSLRARLAHGASRLPTVAAVAVAGFLAVDIGAPWLLFDSPPSPYEAVALKSLCRNAPGTKAACRATDPTRTIAAPGTLRTRLK